MSAQLPGIFSGRTTGPAVKRRLLSTTSFHKPVFVREFLRSSRVVSSGEFVSKKRDNRVLNCSKRGRTGSIANSDHDELVLGVVKEEAFVENSSGFHLNSSDLAGIECILDRMSKRFVASLFWAVILSTRDAKSLWAILGNFLNLWFSTFLKYMLKQERPVPGLRLDPGMPSSHAQTFFFNMLLVAMSIVEWLGTNKVSITLGGLALVLASYLTWLRVSQKFHTISQVVVGAFVGSSFFILWFWSWDSFVQAAYFSNLWVRGIVVSGVTGCCTTLLVDVIRTRLQLKHELHK